MKIHLITIGQPKLAYAKLGWDEYLQRLGHYHQVRVTHIADKQNDTSHLLAALDTSYKVGLVIEGKPFSSRSLAAFLEKRALEGREVSFVIGGPTGLPSEVITHLDYVWSFSDLTFPHDLAMVILVETLYRSSTISAGQPYHK